MAKSFEELYIWKRSRHLSNEIFKDFETFKIFGFRDQIMRATLSIMNNISEGFERGSDRDFIKFLYYSKGSAAEVRSMLYLALDRNYISLERFKELMSDLMQITSGIEKLIRYLKAEESKSWKFEGAESQRVEKSKSQRVEKSKSLRVEKSRSRKV